MAINLAWISVTRNSIFSGCIGFKRVINESCQNPINNPYQEFLLRTNAVPVPFLQITKRFHSVDPKKNEGVEDLISHYPSECIDDKELRSSVSVKKRSAHFQESLQQIFCLNQQEYEDIIRRFPLIWKKHSDTSLKHLHNLGLQKLTLIDYPWLISKDSGNIPQHFSKTK